MDNVFVQAFEFFIKKRVIKEISKVLRASPNLAQGKSVSKNVPRFSCMILSNH